MPADVFFNFPRQYDNGIIPSVGVANGAVAEGHQFQGASTLWYHVGDLHGDPDSRRWFLYFADLGSS